MEKLSSNKNVFLRRYYKMLIFYHLSKRIRETLKEQIEQKDRVVKKILDEKILEYKLVAEQDLNSINEDKRKKVEKLKYLNTFRDENKQVTDLVFFFSID